MEMNYIEEKELPEQGREEAQSETQKTGIAVEEKPEGKAKNPEGKAEEAEKEKRKAYTSGAEKIRDEAEAEYQAAKDEKSKAMIKAKMDEVVKYVSEKCETDPEYNALVIQEHKSWERCDQFMLEKAKKMAPAGSLGMIVEGSTIFEWMDEYYQMDDLAEIKAKEEEEKKQAEDAKQAAKLKKEPKTKTAAKEKGSVPAAKEKESRKVKNNSGDIDGQMDLFSMMGI